MRGRRGRGGISVGWDEGRERGGGDKGVLRGSFL